MTKLAGLSLLYFCIGSVCTVFFDFFGPVSHNEVSYLGGIICLFWSIIFIFQQTTTIDFEVAHPFRLRMALYFLSLLVLSMSVLALLRFGPSPVVGALIGVDTASLLLHGLYREQLPLRALTPPAAVAIGVFVYIGFRKGLFKILSIAAISLLLLFFVSVYETRHVLIWVVLYLIGIEISKNGLIRSFTLSLKNWKLAIFIIALFVTFKTFGEIRSGLGEYLDNAGPAFAQGMGVDQKYWGIGLSLLWIVIYLFSSFARGMENDPLYPMLDFVIPDKILPGFLQFLTENIRPHAGLMQDRFSPQMFAVDAWHTYSLNFGVLGAAFFVNSVIIILFVCVKVLNNKLAKSGTINSIYYCTILWMSSRICLFPFGDYLLDFSAFMELMFFLVIARIAGLRIYSIKSNI